MLQNICNVSFVADGTNVLKVSIVADESNVLDIPIVADGSNVLKIQDVADGTLTNNTTRPQSLLGSLSAFPVWDILRDAAHVAPRLGFWTLASLTSA